MQYSVVRFCVSCYKGLPFVLQCAKLGAHCDYSLFVGASNSNAETLSELAPLTAGLKMYLNDTYTTLRLSDVTQWMKVCYI